MSKKDFIEVIMLVIILAAITSVGFASGLLVSNNKIKMQQNQIDYLNQEIGEYKINEAWFDDYVDVLEGIYEGKINEAVLEERIKWLESSGYVVDESIDYWLVIITSRVRRAGYYIYSVQPYDDSTETAIITSTELLSVGDFALCLELDDDTLILIDFEN